MNLKKVINVIGRMAQVEALLLLLPIAVALYYREDCLLAFAVTAAASLIIGTLLTVFVKPQNDVIYAREGFAIVALVWVVTAAIGALPFTLSGEIPFYVDAFFETVSGFTTTGASILRDVEALSHAALFWRSFSHWLGGMGVLVFIMAIVPNISDRSIHIMRAEMPGPIIGKLVPRVKDTAKILYLIYIVMTIVQVILMCIGGMSFFESLLHSFGTAGTGGFGIKADSIASYSPYLQWVITIFMLLFGINFNLYYLVLLRRIKTALKSGELWCYLGIFAASSALITANTYSKFGNLSDAVRHSAFQVASVMTTTGYGTTDFNLWPVFAKSILLILMFIGACAGSTGGGFKISRLMIIFKTIRRELRRLLHPRSVVVSRLEGKPLDAHTQHNVSVYFAIYMVCIFVIFLILSLEPAEIFDIETNFSAAVSCFNNIGPGLGGVGPASSYADYSVLSKIVLSLAMLLGRLEIFPLLLALSPATWLKK